MVACAPCRAARWFGLALPPALTVALSVASCRDADPARLQANVRLAAATGRAPSRPGRGREPPGGQDRIDELLAAVAAGQEGDSLPSRIEAALRQRRRRRPARRSTFMRGGKATKLVVDALAAAGTPAAQERALRAWPATGA